MDDYVNSVKLVLLSMLASMLLLTFSVFGRMGTEWSPCELAWGPAQSAFVVLTHVYLFASSLTNRCRYKRCTRKRACVCGCGRTEMVSLCASLVSLRTLEGGSKLFLACLFLFLFLFIRSQTDVKMRSTPGKELVSVSVGG